MAERAALANLSHPMTPEPASLHAGFPPEPLEGFMDKEHIKGAGDKVKGAMKDAAGKLTGDDRLRAEGQIDKAKGEAHKTMGDMKDAARKGFDEAKRRANDAD